MNVQAHTTTLRERSRLSEPTPAPSTETPSIEARASKTDSIRIDSVDLPTDYYPGQRVYPAVSLRSSNLAVSIFDPDHCIAPSLINGYRCRILIDVNGRRVAEREVCLASGSGQPYRYEFPNGFTMPRTGDSATVSIRVQMANTGTQVADRERTLSAVQSDPGDPSDPSDPGDPAPTQCPPGYVYDYAQETCVRVDDGGGDGGGGSSDECRGLLDALLRPECSLDAYLSNAQSGAFTAVFGLLVIFFLALAVGR